MRGTRRRTELRHLIAAATAVALLLAGCGADDNGTGPEAGDADAETDAAAEPDGSAADHGDEPATVDSEPEGTIRVSWWGADTRNEKHQAVNELFQDAHPDVTIQSEIGDFGPHWERLTVQTAASDVPCVPQMQSRFLMDYAPRGTLKPLDDFIGEGEDAPIDVSKLVLLDAGRAADGQLYMIPHGGFIDLIMFNTTLMERAGVQMPEAGWTWDDYFELLAETGENLPDDVWASQPRGGHPNMVAGWVAAHGESLFDGQALGFDRDLLIEWMERWEELREAGHLMPMDMAVEEPDSIEESWLALGRIVFDTKSANQMDAHQVGLDAAGIEGAFDMQLYPADESGVTTSTHGGNGWAIGANCPDESLPAALAYIDFWNNDLAAADVYASDNGVVTNTEALELQSETAASPGMVRQFELFQELGEQAPQPTVFASGYAAVEESLLRAYERVAFGEASIEQAVDDFFAEAEQALREVE
jgi:multiple sugar transport system substrate-binding protein